MATDIASKELRTPVNVVDYLYQRLHQMGIRDVHGVPGKALFNFSMIVILRSSANVTHILVQATII